MKRTGYNIMQTAIYLILIGGILDIVYSFNVPSIFPSHLEYLGISEAQVSPELRNLDLALIRSIGGLLVAVAIGALALLYTSVKVNNRNALWGMSIMITIGEGNNILQMILVDSPYFVIPMFFLLLFWLGVLIWVRADKPC